MTIFNSPNHFLATLSTQVYEALERHLAIVDLPGGAVLYHDNQSIPRVYLPFKGMISFVVRFADGHLIDCGSAGCNSVAGLIALHADQKAINGAIVRVAMKAATIEPYVLRGLVADNSSLRLACVRHERMMLVLARQLAACNAVHPLERRLVRCLLQVHDLLDDVALSVSLGDLCQMLGANYRNVASALEILRKAGLLDWRVGLIKLTDMTSLRDASCECYEAINASFYRTIGWRPDLQSDNRS